jgi:hypothetical protein
MIIFHHRHMQLLRNKYLGVDCFLSVLISCVICIIGVGCGTLSSRESIHPPYSRIYILIDDSMPNCTYTYYVRGPDALAVVTSSHRFKESKWYFKALTNARTLRTLCELVEEAGGDASLWSNMWFSRVTINTSNDAPPTIAHFPQHTLLGERMLRRFKILRSVVIRAENLTNAVPDWILREQRIDKRFGLDKTISY